MFTTALVRKHIYLLPADKMFTTRDFLNYGRRSAIDQALHRLVKSQIIIRLAWGVFIKQGSEIPPIADIAAAKAKAFGKEIAIHGEVLLRGMLQKTDGRSTEKELTTNCLVKFAVNGKSSSFRVGNIEVKLLGVTARKMELSKSIAGQVALALWSLGRLSTRCEQQAQISKATREFYRSDREFIKQSCALMPAWLTDPWLHTSYQFLQ